MLQSARGKNMDRNMNSQQPTGKGGGKSRPNEMMDNNKAKHNEGQA